MAKDTTGDLATYCDVCGKSMLHRTRYGQAFNVMAVQFNLNMDGAADVLSPFEAKTYNVCYPCYLRALGVPVPTEAVKEDPA